MMTPVGLGKQFYFHQYIQLQGECTLNPQINVGNSLKTIAALATHIYRMTIHLDTDLQQAESLQRKLTTDNV